MVPSVHPGVALSTEALRVRAGSAAGSLPEDSQRRQSATLFFTGLPREVPPTPRPHGILRLPGLGLRPWPACCSGAHFPEFRTPDLPGGYTLENTQGNYAGETCPRMETYSECSQRL
ncbi:hypothetical protein NN561_009978 [Cricetulus griseus]